MVEQVRLTWLRERSNLVLVCILVLSFCVQLYFFSQVAGQPMWWDEAEYMATAKHWAFDVPYQLNPQRPPLFQALASLLLLLGLSEQFIQFLLVSLPLLGVVYATILLGTELASKPVGLFAGACSALMWSYLFWSQRFQPDFLALTFQLLAFVFFLRMRKKPSTRLVVYAGVFAALGFYFKISALLVPLIIGIYAVWCEGWKVIQNKSLWLFGLAYLLTFTPFMVWQYTAFGNPLAFAPSYTGVEGKVEAGWQPGWMALDYLYNFPKLIVFGAFCVGLLLLIGKLVLTCDVALKEQKRRETPGAFLLIALLTILFFHVYFIRGIIEDRWVFLYAPFIFVCAGIGIERVSAFFNAQKLLGIIFCLFFVLYAVPQLAHATQLLEMKQTSYQPVKDASLWLKENTPRDTLVFSISYTQATAYAEREIIEYRNWKQEQFEQTLLERKPNYLMVSIFENHPAWIFPWVENNSARLQVVQKYPSQGNEFQLYLFKILYDSRT